jgi:hypothetical protein
MTKKLMKSGSALAAEHVKSVFRSCVVVGGGGRGGRASTVLNRASAAAQAAASVFADYFADCERGFDPSAFFRACCLSEAFIRNMERARALYGLRQAAETPANDQTKRRSP